MPAMARRVRAAGRAAAIGELQFGQRKAAFSKAGSRKVPGLRDRLAAQAGNWRSWLRGGVEAAALLLAALIAVIFALGRLASRFSGDSLLSSLLPFAGAVLAFSLAVGAASWLWLRARQWLSARLAALPALASIAAAAIALWLASRPAFHQEVSNLQTMIGGTAEAERQAIAHQVFAAYRRADLAELYVILERGRVYEATIHEAAQAFGVDAEVLMGIAATESSFAPRPSRDGGSGLFQITRVPREVEATVRKRLGVRQLDPWNQRHNAHLGAATLRRYLDQMRSDLFLGLLAYNIGPRNGGLLAIMTRYGARDFVTIQPYLKDLPRDYPIRVLSAALAYRLWRRDGLLPRYEEGDNARRIQHVGIPGLDASRLPRLVQGRAPGLIPAPDRRLLPPPSPPDAPRRPLAPTRSGR